VVSYIDDALLADDKTIVLKSVEHLGIFIHEEKSHDVKYDGKWLKPFTFLGLTYNPFNNKFYTAVHNKDTPVLLLEQDMAEIMNGTYDDVRMRVFWISHRRTGSPAYIAEDAHETKIRKKKK
jgi:hypothetical protein